MTEEKRRDPLAIITEGLKMPDGYDSWAVKSVGFDGRTRNSFEWPTYGPTPTLTLDRANTSSCPAREGDGLCVAATWASTASGGYRAFCVLVVAYRAGDSLSGESGKLRVPQAFVVDRVDGEAFVRERCAGADLHGADLRGAHLHGADLPRSLTAGDARALGARI